MLVVISFDLKFTYVLTRWEGNAYDSRVLNEAFARPGGFSILKDIIGLFHILGFSFNKFCLFYQSIVVISVYFSIYVGKYYLGDAGYGNKNGILSHYRSVRYYLK